MMSEFLFETLERFGVPVWNVPFFDLPPLPPLPLNSLLLTGKRFMVCVVYALWHFVAPSNHQNGPIWGRFEAVKIVSLTYANCHPDLLLRMYNSRQKK